MHRDPDTVTATEIAAWVYCPEQWRLEYGLGLEAGNQVPRDAGNARHAGKAATERVAGRTITLGRVLIVAALAALAIIWALSR